MSNSLFSDVGSLRIGTVTFASPDSIEVQLEIDAPDSVALNAQTPRRFPRINSYLLLANEVGFTVGQVVWIKVVNSPYPKRKGLKDFGLIDLPFPLRTLSLSPIGTLMKEFESNKNCRNKFVFKRGVESFPSVGDGVLLPTDEQLTAVVTSGKDLRVKIGTSPLAANANVRIDPDRLFGRHLAVLGNTGSGKSCTVAGLIRWSLESAENELDEKTNGANARFIILDPNGEYQKAFSDRTPTTFSISPTALHQQLKLPVWFWNSEEWFSFCRASERAQQPVLRRALRGIRNGDSSSGLNGDKRELRMFLSRIDVKLSEIIKDSVYDGWKSAPAICAVSKDLDYCVQRFSDYGAELGKAAASVQSILEKSRYLKRDGTSGYNAFSASDLTLLRKELACVLEKVGGSISLAGLSEDTPVFFDSEKFLGYLEALAEENGNAQLFGYFLSRVKMALSDIKMKNVLRSGPDVTLSSWLENVFGTPGQSQLTIVDLSLVPQHLLYILTSVVSRMVFEALQRHRQVEKHILPTVLVMEEAHNFVKRYVESSETPLPSQICCQVFERIAKEGRKFGLGLVLSSQRPSELSPTVLSQCNSFLLHRITNDKDQELIRRLLPDNLQGLLHDLPTLPARTAILLGWASELPTLVRMRELPLSHQPQSQDPHFWNVWTHLEQTNTDWKTIADDWQETKFSPETTDNEDNGNSL